MLKLYFYNHKTLRHLKKQSFYHCCKCCLCKAYSPDTFQTHLVYGYKATKVTLAVNSPHKKLLKKQSIGQHIDYILRLTLAIRTSLGHHVYFVAVVNLISNDG